MRSCSDIFTPETVRPSLLRISFIWAFVMILTRATKLCSSAACPEDVIFEEVGKVGTDFHWKEGVATTASCLGSSCQTSHFDTEREGRVRGLPSYSIDSCQFRREKTVEGTQHMAPVKTANRRQSRCSPPTFMGHRRSLCCMWL
jgi:hypothetical protein